LEIRITSYPRLNPSLRDLSTQIDVCIPQNIRVFIPTLCSQSGAMKMASISFNPNKMEFLISFASGEISEDKEQEILNLGQAQILMDISQEKGSLVAIKVLLPTPLGEEAMNAVKKSAEKSEIKISSDR
jgi:hypothetical protein